MTDLAYTNRAEYLQMHRERRELILAEVRAGRTYADIGRQFGISKARISQLAAAAGINRKRGGNRRKA